MNKAQFYKSLVGQTMPTHLDENNVTLKMFQILMTSLSILLGPPDYVIADQLNKEKHNGEKKISSKNIRVAYQTLSVFHENADLFSFSIKPKQQQPDQLPTKVEEESQAKPKQQFSTMAFIQQSIQLEQEQQTTHRQKKEELVYYMLFTNKFANTEAILEKSEFIELKALFSKPLDIQKMNSYEQYVYDLGSEEDASGYFRQAKKDQEPKPVSILIKRHSLESKQY